MPGTAATVVLQHLPHFAADRSGAGHGRKRVYRRSQQQLRSKVAPNGIIITVAGTEAGGIWWGWLSGHFHLAISSIGVAVDALAIYITDYGNRQVRKVNTNGIISTIAGDGGFNNGVDGGPAVSVSLTSPMGGRRCLAMSTLPMLD